MLTNKQKKAILDFCVSRYSIGYNDGLLVGLSIGGAMSLVGFVVGYSLQTGIKNN